MRDFRVVPGDCNTTIATALGELAGFNGAPTFAFLDQQSTEVQWSTITRHARHNRADKPKDRVVAALRQRPAPPRPEDTHRHRRLLSRRQNTSMFGTDIARKRTGMTVAVAT